MCLKTLVRYGPPSQARPRRWTESWTGHLVAGKQKRYTWKGFPGGKKNYTSLQCKSQTLAFHLLSSVCTRSELKLKGVVKKLQKEAEKAFITSQ